ncbi:hypothetical protein G9A89_023644 [Geosiphon pyriformis]|nr:hypothetical protein G9A89_023644 [Geosiphon pyriformis]
MEFAKSDQANLLASKWSFLIGKDSVCVAKAVGDHKTWALKNQFKALLFTLPVEMMAHDLGTFLERTGVKTCIINRSLETGNRICCAVVGFESDNDLESAFYTEPIYHGTKLSWARINLICCIKCGHFGHSALECDALKVLVLPSFKKLYKRVALKEAYFRLAKLYEKKDVPISYPAVFGGKSWVQVLANSFSGVCFKSDSIFSSLGISHLSSILSFTSNNNSGLSDCLAVLKCSLELLLNQVSVLLRKLSFVELVSLIVSSSAPLPVAPVSLTLILDLDMVLNNVLVSFTLFPSVGSDLVANFSSGSSKVLTTKVDGLESKMVALETSINLVLGRLNCLCSGLGMNNPTKQEDIVRWHKDMSNLILIITETKLKDKVHLWITNKFDGVCVFTSGLDFGHLGSSIAIVMNSFLVKHVCKVSEVPDQILSIRLLFKNKLSVLVLGLYTGASSEVRFSQTAVEKHEEIKEIK